MFVLGASIQGLDADIFTLPAPSQRLGVVRTNECYDSRTIGPPDLDLRAGVQPSAQEKCAVK